MSKLDDLITELCSEGVGYKKLYMSIIEIYF